MTKKASTASVRSSACYRHRYVCIGRTKPTIHFSCHQVPALTSASVLSCPEGYTSRISGLSAIKMKGKQGTVLVLKFSSSLFSLFLFYF